MTKEKVLSKKKRRRLEIMAAHREGYRDAQEAMSRKLDDVLDDLQHIIVSSQLNHFMTSDDIIDQLEDVKDRFEKILKSNKKSKKRGSGRKTILDLVEGVGTDVRSITMDEQLKVTGKVVNRIIDRQYD